MFDPSVQMRVVRLKRGRTYCRLELVPVALSRSSAPEAHRLLQRISFTFADPFAFASVTSGFSPRS